MKTVKIKLTLELNVEYQGGEWINKLIINEGYNEVHIKLKPAQVTALNEFGIEDNKKYQMKLKL